MAREASSAEPLFVAINSNLPWTAADVSVSISRKPYLTDGAVWLQVDAAAGGVTVPMGAGSEVGQLGSGTWWVHVWINTGSGGTKFLAGPLVIVGGAGSDPAQPPTQSVNIFHVTELPAEPKPSAIYIVTPVGSDNSEVYFATTPES